MIQEQGNTMERWLINNNFSPGVQLGNGLLCSGKLLRNLMCFRKRAGDLCEQEYSVLLAYIKKKKKKITKRGLK